MAQLILGALLGLILAPYLHVPPEDLWMAAAGGALLFYMGSCWRHPYRQRCPWCEGNRVRGDGSGNVRVKNCWICGGGRYRRFGARLLGRG